MTPQKNVFGCKELRGKILSYIPIRCNICNVSMKINNKFTFNQNFHAISPPYWWSTAWNISQCIKSKKYCNKCYYEFHICCSDNNGLCNIHKLIYDSSYWNI